MITVDPKYRGKPEYFRIFLEIITVAKYRGTITYQEIAKILCFPLTGNYMGSEIGHLLGEISEDEVNSGRPMLSAVAVNVSGKPGPGFFELARHLHRLGSENQDDEIQFWENELKSVYDTWKTKLE